MDEPLVRASRRQENPRQASACEDFSDEQLMASSLQGSKSAFEGLYERYARRILGVAPERCWAVAASAGLLRKLSPKQSRVTSKRK